MLPGVTRARRMHGRGLWMRGLHSPGVWPCSQPECSCFCCHHTSVVVTHFCRHTQYSTCREARRGRRLAMWKATHAHEQTPQTDATSWWLAWLCCAHSPGWQLLAYTRAHITLTRQRQATRDASNTRRVLPCHALRSPQSFLASRLLSAAKQARLLAARGAANIDGMCASCGYERRLQSLPTAAGASRGA